MRGQISGNAHSTRSAAPARADGALSANDAYVSPSARSGGFKAAALPTLSFTVNERFQTALFVSALLHAALLLGFKFQALPPDPKLASTLSVVLVNSKSETRPDDAQALAQANLDGGGNTDEQRMAKSPLPSQGRDSARGVPPPPRPSPPPRKLQKPAVPKPSAAPTQAERAAAPPQVSTASIPENLPAPVPQAPAAAPEPSAAEAVPPEMEAIAQEEAAARERVAALEREARELMTQLRAEREIAQPSATFTVPPEYRPRPSTEAPRPAPQPLERDWPPSPPPATTSSSSARVLKVEPQARPVLAQPSITAPPKAEPRTPSVARPVAQVAKVEPPQANAGLRALPRNDAQAEPEPTPTSKPVATPPQSRPLAATPASESSAPKSEAVPAPQQPSQPERYQADTPPAPAQNEVKVVKVEPQNTALEQPQLRPQLSATVQPAEVPTEATPATVTAAVPTQSEMLRNSSELARLEAQIEKDYEEYQKRPRRKFIGARTTEFRYANYIEQWRTKVERVGNTNYPEAARQKKIEGRLQLTVAIKADGTIESVELNRSSGHKVLDAAAMRILEMAAPFARFPPEVSKDTDIIHITRTWSFSREGLMSE